MKVKWLGHASFLITSDAGIKIITDPYTTTATVTYGEIEESADIVTVSHEHGDHNNVAAVGGNPEIVRGSELKDNGTVKVKGIEFNCIPCYHDSANGERLGDNNIICFEVDGLKICHTGDLGHPLSDDQVADIGNFSKSLWFSFYKCPYSRNLLNYFREGHTQSSIHIYTCQFSLISFRQTIQLTACQSIANITLSL